MTAVRVSIDDLKKIFDTELTDDQLYTFINTAHVLVESTLLNASLGSDLLTEIELWLSAHFASIRDQRPAEESIGQEYRVKYQGTTGQGFQATTYGQQALALDYTGTLANLTAKKSSLKAF